MTVHDVWYLSKRGPDGERARSAKYGRGKRWRVTYVDDAGGARERLFARKDDAAAYDAGVRSDVQRGLYVDPAAGRTTVADYWDEWREVQLHADSTVEQVERIGRLHVRPTALGRMQIAQARRSHVQGWATVKASEMSPAYLHTAYAFLAGMFNAAAVDRAIGASPCQGITLPELLSPERYIATPEQIHALADVCRPAADDDGRWPAGCVRAQVYVGATAGLRQGEIWGLELDQVDWLRREIHVAQQLKAISGGPPFLARPKGGITRTVELSDVGAVELAEHVRRYPVQETVIEDRTDPRRPKTRKAQLLFVNGRAKTWRRASFSYIWVPLVAQAGLPAGFTTHNLRHYYATLLIHNGASVGVVQKALGHKTPVVTLQTYMGEWLEATERTHTIIDQALTRPGRAGLRAVTG